MSARSKARKRALDVLYSADVRGQSLDAALADAAARAASEPERAASWQYARDIVDGVIANFEEIDALIESHANGWSLHRMPAVDRAILRLAMWEMLYNPDVDRAVAISEAIQLASELSTDDSSRFINGVLGSVTSDEAPSAD
ncbi:MAG TPA: transcription antitermination factor NusB [Microbacteriaceae bacterium]|nr:transcription antitermination factor NusB [Microbacteriaceae bacterium]